MADTTEQQVTGGAKKARRAAPKTAGAKPKKQNTGGTKKAAKKAAKPEPKEKRFTQSDAIVAAVKALARGGKSATTEKIYTSVLEGPHAGLFAGQKEPKATIRCILQRDRRLQRVPQPATEEGKRVAQQWRLRPEGEGDTAAVTEAPKASGGKKKAASGGQKKKAGGKKKAAAPAAPEVETEAVPGELTVEPDAEGGV